MPTAHETIAIEDDIAGFASKDGTAFREAVDVLSDIADADLYEFVIAAARRRTHIARAVDGTCLIGDDLFEAFEAEKLSSCDEAITWLQTDLTASDQISAVQAVEIFDKELAPFDEQAAVFWGQEGIGRESGIAGPTEDRFVELERNPNAVSAVFIDGNQSNIEIDIIEFDIRELAL